MSIRAENVKSQGAWVDLIKFGLSGLHESAGQQWVDVGEALCPEHGCCPDRSIEALVPGLCLRQKEGGPVRGTSLL